MKISYSTENWYINGVRKKNYYNILMNLDAEGRLCSGFSVRTSIIVENTTLLVTFCSAGMTKSATIFATKMCEC